MPEQYPADVDPAHSLLTAEIDTKLKYGRTERKHRKCALRKFRVEQNIFPVKTEENISTFE